MLKTCYFRPQTKVKRCLPMSSWVLMDRRRQVWVGSEQGVLAINPEDQSVRLYELRSESGNRGDAFLKQPHNMSAAVEDRWNDSLLWIGTDSGLLSFHKKTGQFSRFAFTGDATNLIRANNIRALYQHTDGWLYYGTYHFGLMRFNPASKVFQPLPVTGVVTEQNLWKNIVQIVPKSDTALWVTTAAGLAVLDTRTQILRAVAADNLEQEQFYGVRYVDNAGRYWTWVQSRLILYQTLEDQFQLFLCPKTLGGQRVIIRKIVEDTANARLYLAAQFSKGVYTLDRKTGAWALEHVGDFLPVAKTRAFFVSFRVFEGA